jgi:hypothetical protein
VGRSRIRRSVGLLEVFGVVKCEALIQIPSLSFAITNTEDAL